MTSITVKFVDEMGNNWSFIAFYIIEQKKVAVTHPNRPVSANNKKTASRKTTPANSTKKQTITPKKKPHLKINKDGMIVVE